MGWIKKLRGMGALVMALGASPLAADPYIWSSEWPGTNFDKSRVDFSEILSGGPPKDGIPSIDDPIFVPVSEDSDLGAQEPVIGLEINGDARAYPLRILTWHEIVNDTVGGLPVAVTYCPLCNAAIVFDRRVGDQVLEFGTTGKLRNSDLIMYDRTTESWWQQFLGQAIVGDLAGEKLTLVPARLESWERFVARHPDGQVQVPNNPGLRAYGANPYVGYDGANRPFLYDGDYPEGIEPMARVVAVGEEAWALSLLKETGKIESGDTVLSWEPGQNSALDTREISQGSDVGNVIAQRRVNGELRDIPYDVTFAFVFHAFRPDGILHK
ncbi:MAG: DUF3179 domain-containing protein [Pseudomonadota bacterium]